MTALKQVQVGDWYRTCQECGLQQVSRKPDEGKLLTPAYTLKKCNRCKSEALDYGTYMTDNKDWMK